MNLLTQISDIDFRQVRAFKTVVDCGGITAAELALNKGKSAISADISNLEKGWVWLCAGGDGRGSPLPNMDKSFMTLPTGY